MNVLHWSRDARVGDEVVYYRTGGGTRTSVEADFASARIAHDAGLVFLYQRRTAVGFFDYVAVRISAATARHLKIAPRRDGSDFQREPVRSDNPSGYRSRSPSGGMRSSLAALS